MVYDLIPRSYEQFCQCFAHAIDAACQAGDWASWNLPRAYFVEALRRSTEKHFQERAATDQEIELYIASLYLQDLALACACAQGSEAAWQAFVAKYRSVLYSATRGITRGMGNNFEAQSRDLADSLYAELYGIDATGTRQRKSLFVYFHGRSKLATWLRSVLAQRAVDLVRADRNLVALESDSEGQPATVPKAPEFIPEDPKRSQYLAQFEQALVRALEGLAPRQRMILAQYYLDQQTLAQIGRALGEHESTISRQLQQARAQLRTAIPKLLSSGVCGPKLSEAEIQATVQYALGGDWPFDLPRAIARAEPTGRQK